jgi:hypothetical protein
LAAGAQHIGRVFTRQLPFGHRAPPGRHSLARFEANKDGRDLLDGRTTGHLHRVAQFQFNRDNFGFGDLHGILRKMTPLFKFSRQPLTPIGNQALITF